MSAESSRPRPRVERIAPRARLGLAAAISPVGAADLRVLYAGSEVVHLAIGSRVLSLVARDALLSPVAGVVRGLAELAEAFRSQRSIAVTLASLDATRAAPWDPHPEWAVLRPILGVAPRRTAVLARVRALPELDAAVPIAEAGVVESLAAALVTGNAVAARLAAARLLGRGPGLTPAGDDVLLGALHAAWSLLPSDRAGALGRAVLAGGLERTTSLSGAWLAAAAEGEAVFPWHVLIDAIVRADDAALPAALGGVAAIGATSGRAMLAGWSAVLRRVERLAQPVG